MDILKLRYFYVTAQFENMSIAAKKLLVSQPALSKAIHTLEDELQMDLFHRNGKRITLNENGEFLFKRAEQIFADFKDLERGLEERRQEGSGELSIISTLPYTFSHILNRFFDQYPHARYRQLALSQENLTKFIEYGKYDLCITTKKIVHPNIEWVPLFEEEIYLTVPNEFPEAKLDEIDMSTLRDLPFIGLTQDFSFRQFTDQFCYEQDYVPTYQVEVEEATTILQLVRSGRGAAFTPQTSVSYYDDNIQHIKIKGGQFTRTIGLLKHTKIYETKLAKDFIQHCTHYFENYTKDFS